LTSTTWCVSFIYRNTAFFVSVCFACFVVCFNSIANTEGGTQLFDLDNVAHTVYLNTSCVAPRFALCVSLYVFHALDNVVNATLLSFLLFVLIVLLCVYVIHASAHTQTHKYAHTGSTGCAPAFSADRQSGGRRHGGGDGGQGGGCFRGEETPCCNRATQRIDACCSGGTVEGACGGESIQGR
jgi:hypothetical protein